MTNNTLQYEQAFATLNLNQLQFIFTAFEEGTNAVPDLPFFEEMKEVFLSRQRATKTRGQYSLFEIRMIMAVLANKEMVQRSENSIRDTLSTIFNRTPDAIKGLQYRIIYRMDKGATFQKACEMELSKAGRSKKKAPQLPVPAPQALTLHEIQTMIPQLFAEAVMQVIQTSLQLETK